MWQEYNPNPQGLQVGDCVIRAIAKAMGMAWDDAYMAVCLEGYAMKDLPNANRVWGNYLQEHGFRREWLPDACPAYRVPDCCWSDRCLCDDQRG